MKKLTGVRVEVTQRDIDRGCKAEANNCPIARAIRRTTGMRNPGVTGYAFGLGRLIYKLPKRCDDFVMAFDRYGSMGVEPFTFRIGKEI